MQHRQSMQRGMQRRGTWAVRGLRALDVGSGFKMLTWKS